MNKIKPPYMDTYTKMPISRYHVSIYINNNTYVGIYCGAELQNITCYAKA